MKPRLKSNLHFGWINDPVFRHDVQTILDTIKNNFRPHAECWAAYNTYSATTSNYSFILFPNDDPMINSNTSTSFPDEWHRLLLLFKHWNIINYFNPNNGAPAHPCDSMLYKHVMAFDLAANDQQY
ncbi:MAG TPA: hypothetical protein VNZ86_20475, partial [Bacteroidia bacterium]|nr:hypothetical protein [Bacteroidia bacterium]